MIPYGRQSISDEDIEIVKNVLRSDFLTQGPMVPIFEESVANYCGVKFTIAVNSATSALHIACLALDVGPGDVVWTSANTFAASANCALYCGASVDFVDIDPLTYNIDIQNLKYKLEIASRNGTLPKVLIPVHFAGQPADMKSISQLSREYGFKVIEDASHAIGAEYLESKIGSCSYSDITVFSFHPVKIITTGEGGMALTNNPKVAKKIRQLRSHGMTSDLEDMDFRPPLEIWNYQQIRLGFNYRMTDISAALGVSQLKKIDHFIGQRRKIALKYNESLSDLPVVLPFQSSENLSSFHLFPVRLRLNAIKRTQKEVFFDLNKNGVAVNLHYIPVYLHPYYQALGFKPGHCPNAESYYREALSIPIYPGLTEAMQNEVIRIFTNAIL